MVMSNPAEADSQAIQAQVGIELPAAEDWIQWMPGGSHPITARRGARTVSLTVEVTPAGAAAMQRSLQEHLAGGRQRPYFDFAHEGKAASAWPLEFAWREDPEPGIYARVEWSQAGREAVEGRTYRAFSPMFFVDEHNEVSGAPLNMGALVNDPAFRAIAPLWARDATGFQPQSHSTEDRMSELSTKTELAALQAKVAALEDENTALKAREGQEQEEAAAAIAARDAELAEAKRRLEELNRESKERARRDAEAIVASAVSRGAIAPKDTAGQERWRDLIVADPKNAELLARQPGNPALSAARSPDTGRAAARAVQVVAPDINDVLRAFAAAASPLERGQIYAREINPLLERGERIPFERFAAAQWRRPVDGQIPIEAANVLGTVAGNLISQRILALMVSRRPMLRGVCTDFSAERARLGQTVYTRTVGLPAVNNFGTGAVDTAMTDYTVQMANHKEVHFAFTTAEYLSTHRNLVEETSEALATALGNHMVDAVAALITTAFTSVTTGAANTKDFSDVTKAAKALNVAGAPEFNRSMWINSDFAEAIENDDVVMEYVSSDMAAAYGHWKNVKGFANIWEYPALPTTSNLIGFAFQQNALLLATRVADNPEALIDAGYPGSLQVITDPITGFSVLTDRWVAQATRNVNTRMDVLYGCARGVVAAGHRFASA